MSAPPATFTILPSAFTCKEIVQFQSKFVPDGNGDMTFGNLLTRLVAGRFTTAYERMGPLMREVHIKAIEVGLDLKNAPDTHLAVYHVDRSDKENGLYRFTARSALVLSYLENYHHPDIPLSPNEDLTWEHELVHLLDHGYLAALDFNLERPDVTEMLVRFLLRFRSEGIAEFFHFMRNHGEVRSMKSARTRFKRILDKISGWDWDNPRHTRQLGWGLHSFHEVYTLGSLMILHVMGCEANPAMTPRAAEVAMGLRKRLEYSDEQILEMTGLALKIDHHTFLDCLTKPGPDGQPFVSFDDLEDLARYIELCKADMERVWSQPAQLRGDPKIVELFRLLRPRR